ncbi:MAG TPA: methyl-accepting chemotaxis protein [Steroidobacteraceae bacterium]|nr:methyl-accepting chemotaxis protein [Steroidobacteraceae bacterium]
MNFFDMSVRSKLRATLALQSVLLVVVGAVGFFGARTTNHDLQTMFEGRMVPAAWMHEITAEQRKSLETLELAEIKQDAASVAQAASMVADHKEKIDATWSRMEKIEASKSEREVTTRFGEQSKSLAETLSAAVALVQSNKFNEAEKLTLSQARPKYEELTKLGESLQTAQIEAAQNAWSESQIQFKQQAALVIAVVLAGVVLGVLLGGVLIRSIVSTLSSAVGVADRIASGHLGNDVAGGGSDELGQLLSSLRKMDAKLVEIVGSARTSAGAVGGAAR